LYGVLNNIPTGDSAVPINFRRSVSAVAYIPTYKLHILPYK